MHYENIVHVYSCLNSLLLSDSKRVSRTILCCSFFLSLFAVGYGFASPHILNTSTYICMRVWTLRSNRSCPWSLVRKIIAFSRCDFTQKKKNLRTWSMRWRWRDLISKSSQKHFCRSCSFKSIIMNKCDLDIRCFKSILRKVMWVMLSSDTYDIVFKLSWAFEFPGLVSSVVGINTFLWIINIEWEWATAEYFPPHQQNHQYKKATFW